MFFGIKSNALKMERTLPTIWIIFENNVPHCWIPREDYELKLKNLVQPPFDYDEEARKEWYYSECEILFNAKAFHRIIDCEIALREQNSSSLILPSQLTSADSIANDVAAFVEIGETVSDNDDASEPLPNDAIEPFRVAAAEPFLNDAAQPFPKDATDSFWKDAASLSTIAASDPKGANDLFPKDAIDPFPKDAAKPNDLQRMSESERYEHNKRLCLLHNFRPPISPRTNKKIAWRYVQTVAAELEPGQSFKTLNELAAIPRKHVVPFCWPGPYLKDDIFHFYLADSIVQEVYLKSDKSPYYVVRWSGYEDEYNTVEPFANVKHTSVYKLFVSPDLYTASGANSCTMRRSQSKAFEVEVGQLLVNSLLPNTEPTRFEEAMKKLKAKLDIEEKGERYCPEIGFFSKQSVAHALKVQDEFLINEFLPIVEELGSTVKVDPHYIGNFVGNLGQAAEFKELSSLEATFLDSIKDYICRGSPMNGTTNFITFFAPRKFGTAVKKSEVHMNLHMCVLAVRSAGNSRNRDAIYFDPSPFNRSVPSVIQKIKKPKLRTFTKKFGAASETDDCLFQCMQYIIGLATGEVAFEPDPSKPVRKLDILMKKRAAKKRKLENS